MRVALSAQPSVTTLRACAASPSRRVLSLSPKRRFSMTALTARQDRNRGLPASSCSRRSRLAWSASATSACHCALSLKAASSSARAASRLAIPAVLSLSPTPHTSTACGAQHSTMAPTRQTCGGKSLSGPVAQRKNISVPGAPPHRCHRRSTAPGPVGMFRRSSTRSLPRGAERRSPLERLMVIRQSRTIVRAFYALYADSGLHGRRRGFSFVLSLFPFCIFLARWRACSGAKHSPSRRRAPVRNRANPGGGALAPR